MYGTLQQAFRFLGVQIRGKAIVSKLGAPEVRCDGCKNTVIAQHICDHIRLRAPERSAISVKAHCKTPRMVYEEFIMLGWWC